MGSDELSFEATLKRMWSDVEAGGLQELNRYQAFCPGRATEIESEYHAIEGRVAERPASLPSTLSTGEPPGGLSGESPLPQAIGRYRILDEMPAGGMGRLLLGEDPVLGRRVVLKTVNRKASLSGHGLERLMIEARVGGRLHHPNLCPVLDLVQDDELFFVVMPFVEGRTLADAISEAHARTSGAPSHFLITLDSQLETRQDGPPSSEPDPSRPPSTTAMGEFPALLRLAETIARAVHAAHEAGIIHRDLKPANIMLEPDGQPVVMDFGLALDLDPANAARLTTEGTVMGTLHYMAPEQATGNAAAIGPRTDIWALGAILYELITLRRPVEGTDYRFLLIRIIRGDIRRPRKLNPRIPPDLEAVCLKALALEPDLRYATALEMAEDLQRVRLLKPTHARPLSAAGRAWRLARRNPTLTVTASIILLLAVTLGILAVTLRDRDQELSAREAFDRWEIQHLADPESPNPDEDLVRSYVQDDRVFARIQGVLGTPVSRRLYDKRLKDLYRSDEDRVLHVPCTGILESRPSFRFRGWVDDPESITYRLKVFRSETYTPLVSWTVPGTDISPDGMVHTELPEGRLLPFSADRPLHCTWSLEVLLGRTTLKTHGPGSFFLVSPELRRRTLSALRPTGEADLDRELQALALITLGLASEAAEILDALPPPGTVVGRDRRVWLGTLADTLRTGKPEAAEFLEAL